MAELRRQFFESPATSLDTAQTAGETTVLKAPLAQVEDGGGVGGSVSSLYLLCESHSAAEGSTEQSHSNLPFTANGMLDGVSHLLISQTTRIECTYISPA